MRRILIAVLAIVMVAPALIAQQEMNNEAILKMVKAGLSGDIVAATVSAQPGHYDISPDALIALKKAGASDKIISAMIARNAAPAPASAPAASAWPSAGTASGTTSTDPAGIPPGVDSVGLYVKGPDGAWTEVSAEVVNFKTGGALKHIGSAGIIKGDLNGYVAGFHSHLPLKLPAEFILYVPEGRSPGEYQLLRFRITPDSREFRSLTGGVAHAKGGAVRDTVDFATRKIAPRVYQISLGSDIGKGEYGFLPPPEMGAGKNIESGGKAYTFTVGD